jgi:hypothetical protein
VSGKRGLFTPETAAEAAAKYGELGSAAQTVTRELARAMAFDREEYGERVTGEVVETARDALFASLLEVELGDREAFEAVREEYPDYELRLSGNENVPRVAWHVAPAAETIVAVTFSEEPDAAAAALRRQAHGAVYRPLIDGEE